jgi:Aspartyl/Asparaginyl beta-hydroxylase
MQTEAHTLATSCASTNVLASSPHVGSRSGSETVHMAPGELWWFDHQVEHHVENDGPDRIHLIFYATAPGYTGASSK